MGMRALVATVAVLAVSPAWADATVPEPAPATSRAEGCKARMEEARQALANTPEFSDVHLVFDHGYNPGSSPRDDWEVTVSAMSGSHKLSGMVGIGNSGQWSFFPRGRWFDNSGMWKQTFRMERYPAGAHEIAAIIEGDHIPLRRARAFAAIVRPAIDDCLSMPR
jgi:hypothetical protein